MRNIMYKSLLFGCVLLVFGSCQSDDESTKPEFDRKALLESVIQNEILPATANASSNFSDLSDAANAFTTAPDLEKLNTLRTHWKQSKRSWNHAELYNIGTVRQSFVYSTIDNWPTNTTIIENHIEAGTYTTEEAVAGSGSNAKGLPAIEYLLFGDDQIILEKFTTDAYATERKEFLKATCAVLKTDGAAVHAKWENDEDRFTNALANGLSGSLNSLVNGQIALLEKMVFLKIAKPAGLSIQTAEPNPELLEAFRSSYALHCVNRNLAALKTSYDVENNQSDLSALLIHSDRSDLDNAIKDKFAACANSISEIDEPLREAIYSQPEKVAALHENLRQLLILFKTDLSSALSITVTFSDNDGD